MHLVLFLHREPIEGGAFRYLDVWQAELFAGVVSLRGSRWQGCHQRLDPSWASVGPIYGQIGEIMTDSTTATDTVTSTPPAQTDRGQTIGTVAPESRPVG